MYTVNCKKIQYKVHICLFSKMQHWTHISNEAGLAQIYSQHVEKCFGGRAPLLNVLNKGAIQFSSIQFVYPLQSALYAFTTIKYRVISAAALVSIYRGVTLQIIESIQLDRKSYDCRVMSSKLFIHIGESERLYVLNAYSECVLERVRLQMTSPTKNINCDVMGTCCENV